jgi:hypothetical protein
MPLTDDEELRQLFFPGVPPRYIVGERVAFDLEAPGGRAAGAGCPRSEYDSNWHQFSIGRAAMSLFSRDNCRVGTPENTIEVRDCGAGVVALRFRVTSTALPIAADPRAGEPELDIYADPGEPADPEVLKAVHTLHAGLWPDELTKHAGGPWPARGSRPLARAVTPEHGQGHVGPADLLPHVTHPFDRRFLRLPMGPLLAAARTEQRGAQGEVEIEVPVRVGRRFAPGVTGLLAHRLRLNHAVFFNRTVGQVEPDTTADRDDDGPVLLPGGGADAVVLECTDVIAQRSYVDVRFSYHADSARQFVVEPAGGADAQLRFLGRPVPRSRLRIRYLRPVDWGGLSVRPGETAIERDRLPWFLARTAPAPDPAALGASAGAGQRLAWQAAGPAALPRSRLVTAADLARAAWAEMPPPLREAVVDRRSPDDPHGLTLAHVARVVPRDSSRFPRTLRGLACVVTTLTLPLKPTARPEDLRPYADWLGRVLEPRCPAGTFLEVLLDRPRPS